MSDCESSEHRSKVPSKSGGKKGSGGRGGSKRATIGSGNGCPAPKKRAKTSISFSGCALCGKSGKESALIEVPDSDNPGTFVELCSAHSEAYSEALSHIPVSVFVAEAQDGDRRKQVQEVVKNLHQPIDRAYRAECVRHDSSFVVDVSKRFNIMNKREYKTETGFEPLERYVRYLPTMELIDENGQPETVFVFLWDPTSHLRTVSLSYKSSVVRSRHLMKEESHLFEKQGEDVFAWKSGSVREESGAASLPKKVKSLMSHLESLRPPAAENTAAAKHAKVPSPKPRKTKDEDPDRQPESVSEDDGSDEQEVSATSFRKPLLSTGARQAAAPSSKGRRADVRQLRRMKANLGCDDDDDDFDAMSQHTPSKAPGGSPSVYSASSRGMLTSASAEVEKWYVKLVLFEVMEGKHKLQIYHAGQAEIKLRRAGRDEEANKLKKHLKLCAMAQSLTIGSVGSLSDDELNAVLDSLCRVTPFPLEVQTSLVQRRGRDLMAKVNDLQSFDDFLSIASPWADNNGSTQFDPHKPVNSTLPATMAAKVSTFRVLLFKEGFSKLISQGESKMHVVSQIVERLQSTLNGITAKATELTESESAAICEMITALGALGVATRPAAWLLQDDGKDILMDIVTFLDMANTDSEIGYTALACEENMAYHNRFTEMIKKESVLRESHDAVCDHMQALTQSKNGTFADRCVALEAAWRGSPQLITALGDIFTADYIKHLLANVEGLISEMDKTDIARVDDASALTKMLSEASTALPMDPKVSGWVAEFGSALACMTTRSAHESVSNTFGEVIEANAVDDATERPLESAIEKMKELQITDGLCSQTQAVAKILFTEALNMLGTEAACRKIKQARNMISFVPEERVLDTLDQVNTVLLKMMTMIDMYEKYKSECADDQGRLQVEKAEGSSSVVDLHSAYTDAKGHYTELEKHVDPFCSSVVQKCVTWLEDVKKTVADCGDALLAAERTKLETAVSDTSSIHGGLKDGGNWLDGIDNKSQADWKKLEAHAHATIMKDGVAAKLKPKLAELDEAQMHPPCPNVCQASPVDSIVFKVRSLE